MGKQNFVSTRDEETAKKLRELGLQEIQNSNGFFTFINCNLFTFGDLDKSKIKYTNNLSI